MDYIFKLAEKGYKFFPCYLNKKPKTSIGFYAASNNPDQLHAWFDNDPEYLVGFPCGLLNKNIVALDFDLNKDGDTRTFEELVEVLEEISGCKVPLNGFRVQTMNGGFHLLYQGPEGVEIKGGTRFFDKSLPIDFQSSGKYIIFADNKKYVVYDSEIEIEDFYNHLPPLPDEILNFKKRITLEEAPQYQTEILPESEIREIRSALAFLNSDDRDEWIRAGLELKSTGSPSVYGLWNEWSQKSEKYNPAEMEKRWKTLKPKDVTIASLFYRAKKAGWVTTYEKRDISTILMPGQPEGNLEPIQQITKELFPEDLLNPSGLVGDIARYILETSIKPQPVFALAGALCAVGVLAGRKVRTNSDLRTNIYCLCVGASGSGKDAPRQTIKKLFFHAGCRDMIKNEELASGTAITNTLNETPTQLFLLDEIGRFIRTTNGINRPTHLQDVITILLKLYSNANSIFSGKSYADVKKHIEINQPHLCLYGTTVPDSLYKGMPVENIEDGFLARMLIFETDDDMPEKAPRRELISIPPAEIIDQIKALNRKPINFSPNGNLDKMNPCPQIIPLIEQAKPAIEAFDKYINNLRKDLKNQNKIESIYSRTSELAERIALIIAVGRNIDNPVIGDYEMGYGIKLAHFLSNHMAYIVNNYISTNNFEHEVKRVLNIIRKTGQIQKSALTARTQHIQPYMRNEIIDTLIESNQLEERIYGEGPKKTIWYNIKGMKGITE